MNRPLAQQKEEATACVLASRRTRTARPFDNANEHARQREEERLAKRKPKRKKFVIVMMHGYEQSVFWTDDDELRLRKTAHERPIEIKRKAAPRRGTTTRRLFRNPAVGQRGARL